MKRWKCTVCGYIHTGEEPPEICPVCGADKSKFVLLEDETEQPIQTVVPESPLVKKTVPHQPEKKHPDTQTRLYALVIDLISRHHLHPISVHIPNGVLPVSVLFLLIAVLFSSSQFATAGFYNLVVVLMAMPVVLFSGYIDWKKRYGGAMTRLFITKMLCGAIVLACLLIIVIWSGLNPGVSVPDSPGRWAYFAVHIVMLAATGLAGFLGGKLVFKA